MMFHPPIFAANDAGALIWIIIMVFWAISTVTQKMREKKEVERRRALRPAGPSGTPPPPPPTPPKEVLDPEEQLRRFLQEITGTAPAQPKPQVEQPPESLPPAKPRPLVATVQKRKAVPPPAPSIQFDEPSAAPVAPPVMSRVPGAYTNTTQEIGSANDAHIYEVIGEIEDIEVLMNRQAATLYSGETMVRQDSMLVNLSRIRVPLMTLPFVSYKSVRNAANRPQLIGNRNVLNEALIARVILGPCKAFDAAPGKDGLANQ